MLTINQLTNLCVVFVVVSVGQGCAHQPVLENVVACTYTRPGETHSQTMTRLDMQLSKMDQAFVNGSERLTESIRSEGSYKIRSVSISSSQIDNVKIIKVEEQLCAVKQ